MNALKLALAATATAAAGTASAGNTHNRVADPVYAMAMHHYAAGRYAQAATALRESASRGNAAAAETLGFMLYFGNEMYAGAVATNRQQGLRWLIVAANSGRERAKLFVEQPIMRSGVSSLQ